MTVQTACSTSLVAICQAVQSLLGVSMRHGAGRRRLDFAAAEAGLSVAGRGHHVRGRPLPRVRRAGRRHRLQQRPRRRRAEAAGRRRRRRRPRLRGHQGIGGQQRRVGEGEFPRAGRGRARRGDRDGAGLRAHRRQEHRVHRGTRHGHRARRRRGSRSAHAGVPLADARRRFLRARLRQDEHRTPGRGGRRRGPDQGGARAAAPHRASDAPLHVAQSTNWASRSRRSSSTPRRSNGPTAARRGAPV